MHAHQLTGRKLSRQRDQRQALLKSLAVSLFTREKITTTKPKAKALQPYAEKLITKAKQGGLEQKRRVMAVLANEAATEKLFEDLAKRFGSRHGGYTSIKAAGWRRGDNAELATISLTEPAPAKPPVEEKSRTRAKAKAPEPSSPAKKEVANAKA